MGKLTEARESRVTAFVEAYVGAANFSVTEAARAAGYTGSPAQLCARGSEILKLPDTPALIRAKINTKTGVDVPEVLANAAKHLRGDMTHFLTTDGEVELDLKAARAGKHLGLVKKFKQRRKVYIEGSGPNAQPVEETTVEIELYEQTKAREFLGKYLGMFPREERDTPVAAASIDEIVDALIRWNIDRREWKPGELRALEIREQEQQRKQIESTVVE